MHSGTSISQRNRIILQLCIIFLTSALFTRPSSSYGARSFNQARSSAAAKPPNIVFILADDYGFADVGYHQSAIETPTLDRLARKGVRLENYYVQPICTPTRSQLLSGRYQIHTGLQHSIVWPCQRNGLPVEMPTIADRLKLAGYKTHMVGKWHIGFYEKQLIPTQRGFDSFFGYLTGSEDYYTHIRCYEPGSYQDSARVSEAPVFCGLDLRSNESVASNFTNEYSTHVFARHGIEVIEQHAKQEANKPLFLYLPFQAVHSPLEVPEEYSQKYAHIKDKNRRIYAGMVSCLDEAIANITQALEKHGLWNNTILVFSTDNGGQILDGGNNWPLRGWKGSMWDGGMKGVGFVSSPLIGQPGSVYRGLLHVTDWFPTLVNIAGGNVTGLSLDGHDVWESISYGAESPREELLHNIDPLTPAHGARRNGSRFDTRIAAAIHVGYWKLITGDPGNGSWIAPPEDSSSHSIPDPDPPAKNLWLFNLAKDPSEVNDLSADHPDIVEHLLNRLASYQATAVPARFPKDDVLCDPSLHGGAWGPWV